LDSIKNTKINKANSIKKAEVEKALINKAEINKAKINKDKIEKAEIKKAKIGDVPQIQQLVNYFADKGLMLARPLSEIYENLRDYFVVRQNGKVLACAALHINWSDLAEVKALAVNETAQKKGLGAGLVAACVQEARDLDIPVVFCLTFQPEFFEKQHFARVDKMKLPRKVWSECFHCPKFPDCDEVALFYPLKEGAQLG
jgi:amino-acid N-acetyltransferase